MADPGISKRGGTDRMLYTPLTTHAHAIYTSRVVRLGRKKGGHVPLVPYAGSATGNSMQEWLLMYVFNSMQEWLVMYVFNSMQEWLIMYGYNSMQEWLIMYGYSSMQEWLVMYGNSSMQEWLVMYVSGVARGGGGRSNCPQFFSRRTRWG